MVHFKNVLNQKNSVFYKNNFLNAFFRFQGFTPFMMRKIECCHDMINSGFL